MSARLVPVEYRKVSGPQEQAGGGEGQKALSPRELEWRQPSGRQISVNELNFIPENKDYVELGSLGTNPFLH